MNQVTINPKSKQLPNLEGVVWVQEGTPEDYQQWKSSLGHPPDKNIDQYLEYWRRHGAPSDAHPIPIFPDKDSNNNPCFILSHNPNAQDRSNQSGVYASGHGDVLRYVLYPGDTPIQRIATKLAYEAHHDKLLSHFALATLLTWPAGDIKSISSVYSEESAAGRMTSEMGRRAIIQGYLLPAGSSSSLNYRGTEAIRTNKPIEIEVKRSRVLKTSAWPFSEKIHWLKVVSGPIQVIRSNLRQTLTAQSGRRYGTSAGNRKLNQTYPTFKTHAAFRKARQFFEELSIKKNSKAFREHQGTKLGISWDPLKTALTSVAYMGSHASAYESLFATPYALIKTSVMLCCVPRVEEDGSVKTFQELTPEYIKGLQEDTPLTKSVVGLWQGRSSGYSRGALRSTKDLKQQSPLFWDALDIDNLTHMYMLLLNESHLLSSEDLVRWCRHQGLVLTKSPFKLDWVTSQAYKVYGYVLTDTLKYTCIVCTTDTQET